ncbi:unnamed protein product [Rhodiola kirilowii]
MLQSSTLRCCVKTTTPFLTMSLRPTSSLSAVSQLRHRPLLRINSKRAVFFNQSPFRRLWTGNSRSLWMSSEVDWRRMDLSLRRQRCVSSIAAVAMPYRLQRNEWYGRFAYDVSSEEEERYSSSWSSSKQKGTGQDTLENMDSWRWKFTMLLRDNNDQELVSTEKKDRRDFEQLSGLATRMGLHCRQYSKAVVFSKSPLQNYRADLDDKRPQREVILPFGLQKEVDAHIREHLAQKLSRPAIGPNFSKPNDRVDTTSLGSSSEVRGPVKRSVLQEKLLQNRSLQLRDQQQNWENSVDGQKMLEFRKSLPAYKERDALLKVISENQVVVVSGETGCGKTTQLPQYILESEVEACRGASCSIICTQPRRISAMSVSERVAAERGEPLGESVGYKVRLEGVKGRDTRLLFCTTGILLRRLLVDRDLTGVTHVIVDEIHERGMNEDFLLVVLKDLMIHRPNLRLILMSATLNAELFSSYFGGAPMIHIPGFTYPVRSHFLEDILETTGYKLTQYNQIDEYGFEKKWKMEKQSSSKKKSQLASAVEGSIEVANYGDYSSRTQDSLSCWNPDSIGFNLIEHVLCHIVKNERSGAILVFLTGWDDINSLKDQLQYHPLLGDKSKILLLACHGSMDSSEQRLIFDKSPDGVIKIVLATNMAETSITINDVVFVIDCGKAKETSYDALNNTPCLLPTWISKAAARQRRGRAGRVQPGECYHLYPRCVYENFNDYQLPELLRTPLQSLCLQIKSLQLGSISDFLSRALQAPEPLAVQNAVDYLKVIGALDEHENLTVLGRHLSMLPVEPKLGKMLILGAIFNCLDPVLTVVAGLSSRDPFLMPYDRRDLAERAKSQFVARGYSDHLAVIRAYEGWKDAERQQSGHEYCWRNFLSGQTLKNIDSLRKQFFFLIKDSGLIDGNAESYNKWSQDEHLIRAIICSGLFPGICSVVNKEKSILLKTMEDGPVLLCLNSANAQEHKIPYPWLVFNEKMKVNSVFLRDSTAVSDSVLLLFGGKTTKGGLDGHLKMLDGYLEFFMKPTVADMYMTLKEGLNDLVMTKLQNPKLDINIYNELLLAVRLLVSEDHCEGRFVFNHQVPVPNETKMTTETASRNTVSGVDNAKNQLQTLLARGGHELPIYSVKQLKNNQFQAVVMFNGLDFVGQPCSSKKAAEKDAAHEALQWLAGDAQFTPSSLDHVSGLLKRSRKRF